MLDEPVIEEDNNCSNHILIPTYFYKCGHTGHFRWSRKEFQGFCKLMGWTYKVERKTDEIAV
jgi:hypothetical protein